ncbi:glycosyltransferase family 2 protein [Acinetobacter sp. ANC 4173]|uniref:glycosyltransferase family 2 protein n=1 Tax=Acinetobacter sp. ANC 4173 TaxID=2529837 RepID=UPI001038FF0B|nr:glycosyltransferase family 2 protein [Acinetobacter sp. ANC 4173]TCB80460.1 glycosyltransferase family 2 protein [Acinetobacter sp. ANC 4173]
MLISVIIPAYNASKTICATLDSLLGQTKSNFEVLIIDDGSIDNTYEVCATYTSEKKFRVIKQENKGVSAARNLGINNAKGDYILFMDADDFISKSAINEIYEHLEKNNSDIVFFNYYIKNNNEEMLVSNSGEIVKDEIIVNIMKGDVRGFVWNKVFRKSFIQKNNLFFSENLKYCEDEEFLLDSIWLSNKISYLNAHLYYYIQHENSFTNQKTNDFFNNKFLPYILSIEKKPYFKAYGKFLILKASRLRLYRFKTFGNYESELKKYIEDFSLSLFDGDFSFREKILYLVAMNDLLMRVYCSK